MQLNATKNSKSLGTNTVSYDTVKDWFWKFNAENFETEDYPRSGRPVEVLSEKLKQIIDKREICQRELLR